MSSDSITLDSLKEAINYNHVLDSLVKVQNVVLLRKFDLDVNSIKDNLQKLKESNKIKTDEYQSLIKARDDSFKSLLAFSLQNDSLIRR